MTCTQSALTAMNALTWPGAVAIVAIAAAFVGVAWAFMWGLTR